MRPSGRLANGSRGADAGGVDRVGGGGHRAHQCCARRSARRTLTTSWNAGVVLHGRRAWPGQVDGPLGGDAPGAGGHDHHPVAEDRRLGHRVGDEQDRRAGLLPQLEQQVAHVGAGDLVERGERLVHQQDRRAEGERAHERDALLHAARQLVRVRLLEPGEADRVEQPGDLGVRQRLLLGAAAPVQAAQEPDVVGHGLPRHERRRLGHEPVLLAGAGGVGAAAGHQHGAARRALQAADDAQQGGLAAAARPQQADELAGADVEVHTGQRSDRPAAAGEQLVDVAQRHQRVDRHERFSEGCGLHVESQPGAPGAGTA